MKRVLIGVAAVVLILHGGVQAKEPKEAADAFFGKIKAGQIDEAYDFLFQGSGIAAAQPQGAAAIKSQTKSVLPLYGSILGYDFVRQEEFGTSVVRLVYILKQEKAPTVWEFYFYKPADKWFLGNVRFNDQFQLLERKN